MPYGASAQELLEADGHTDTYELVRSKGLKLEVPDCIHPVKHVFQIWDNDLKKYVFVFDSHVNIDNDRCRNYDRQRTELTVCDSLAPAFLAGKDGTTFTYTWKFKLDADFQANSTFCHIHQLKAVGGTDDSYPIITLTTRSGKSDKLQLIYVSASRDTTRGTVAEINLSALKGEWVEASERVTFNKHGKFSIVLRRVRDGSILLSYTKNDIEIWREGALFYRPKIGMYRSLKNKSILRDESVRFADFCISVGSFPCSGKGRHTPAPAAPKNLTSICQSPTQVDLSWSDNSYNENGFRIEQSTDGGNTWTLLTSLITPWETTQEREVYTVSGLSAGMTYSFRVRAENLFGSSKYSDTTTITTQRRVVK